MLGQPILILADHPQLMLYAHVILESAVLRIDIAVIELLNKECHSAFSFAFLGETRALSA
jgi:hypothetical protein